jgi:hypothetical protein
VFDSGGRCQINVSGVFASVIYAHAVSSTFPFVVSVTGINPASMEFFAQFPNGANVTGAATLRFIIIGNRK